MPNDCVTSGNNESGANLNLLNLLELLTDLDLVANYDLPPERLPHRKLQRSKKCPDTTLIGI